MQTPSEAQAALSSTSAAVVTAASSAATSSTSSNTSSSSESSATASTSVDTKERKDKKEKTEAGKEKAEEVADETDMAEFCFNMGCEYESFGNVKDAFGFFLSAAERKHIKAMRKIAELYDTGIGVEKDRKKTFEWYELIALAGKADAVMLHNLGWAYMYGEGLERNDEKAFFWLTKSFEKGENDISTLNCLGLLYKDGRGTRKNCARAYTLFQTALNKGDKVHATNNMAILYEDGSFVKQDMNLAQRLYTLSASNNNPNACNNLSNIYYGKNDFSNAYKYAKKGAELNDVLCMKRLGKLYEDGNGVDPNIDQACQWYKKAVARGLNEAKIDLERAEKRREAREDTTVSNASMTFSMDHMIKQVQAQAQGQTSGQSIQQFTSSNMQSMPNQV